MASELLWARIFDFAIRDSEWFRRQTLNPGRWALGFPALYILFRTLEESRPQRILEFGLGESTRMTGQYAAHFAGVELTVVEQNEEWKATFCSRRPELRDSVKIVPIVSRRKRLPHRVLARPCISPVVVTRVMVAWAKIVIFAPNFICDGD